VESNEGDECESEFYEDEYRSELYEDDEGYQYESELNEDDEEDDDYEE
jgi:hypothetical protein